ncbi:MAG: hypothetical protein V4642_02420 [Bacteroidota bacterium]
MSHEEMYSVFRTVMDEGNPGPILAQKAIYAGIIGKIRDFKAAADGSGCLYFITDRGDEIYTEIRPEFAEFED